MYALVYIHICSHIYVYVYVLSLRTIALPLTPHPCLSPGIYQQRPNRQRSGHIHRRIPTRQRMHTHMHTYRVGIYMGVKQTDMCRCTLRMSKVWRLSCVCALKLVSAHVHACSCARRSTQQQQYDIVQQTPRNHTSTAHTHTNQTYYLVHACSYARHSTGHHAQTHTRTILHLHMCIINMHIHVNMYIYICTYIHTHTYIHMYIYMHVYINIPMCAYTLTQTHTMWTTTTPHPHQARTYR